MDEKKNSLLTIFLIGALILGGGCIADSSRQDDIETAARSALDAMKELQRNGGWAMAWAEDGSATFGEWLLRENDIVTVQPPATPGIGMSYLKAYKVLNDPDYLEKALQAGDALINGQLEHGGFPQEFYPDLREQDSTWFQDSKNDMWVPQVPGADIFLKRGPGTFDDKTTQFATQFLVKLWKVSGEERFGNATRRSANFMLEAQYSNGCWPQKYPLQDNYTRYITLNDAAMMDVMRTLFILWESLGDIQYYEAALRGADCLLELQGDPPQAGWAQQYTSDGKFGWGRPWEPPSLSSRASINVLEVLLEVYMKTGDKRYLEKGYRTFEWLLNSQLNNGKWAMYYEYGTNKPIYAGADREITYQYKEALEYHPGYSWHGNYIDPDLKENYEKLLTAPPDERQKIVVSEPEPFDSVRTEALKAVVSLNKQGFWTQEMNSEYLEFFLEKFGPERTVPKLIHSRTTYRNMESMLDYLILLSTR